MKHKVFLLLIPYLLITACSKDDDNDGNTDKSTDKSSAKEMVSFTFLASDNDELSEDAKAVLDKAEKKATVTLPFGTPVTSLRPVIEVSQGATIDPADKTDTDFSSAVRYTVTAEDGSTAVYTVSVLANANALPGDFTLTAPEEGATGISVFPTFGWEAATDPDGDTVTYDLYLGTAEDALELYAEDLGDTTYEPSERLLTYQTYYWQVEALDDKGGTTSSGIGAFTVQGLNFEAEAVTTNAAFSGRRNHTSVTFDGKLWVIGGLRSSTNGTQFNDVWYSEDGTTWTEATDAAAFGERAFHTSITFDGKLWVIGGLRSNGTRLNDVWYSEDGTTWTEATDEAAFGARHSHTSAVFDNKLWVIGGSATFSKFNDVWYSEDGVNWTAATEEAAFVVRSRHTSVTFDDKLWIIGGSGNDFDSTFNTLNDVWYSEDGVSWTAATQEARFFRRANHTSVTFDEKLWVIGGSGKDFDNTINDVWYSEDGTNWTRATNTAAFTKRFGHTSAVFDDRLWVIGGEEENGNNELNDVWAFGIE
ncbi:hypothetical protein LV716_03170 [Flagellimonas sp. HMM57]|uniref:kelch repeat-containing protein n=1 Tax=unclassified Flagellimonas TaxID=2644544 RepID=UPI0013D175E5|nr:MULTISPECIES: kelch repeat-containing protein [unclassified Flagellimonas]UII76806.1 hypothetical protein LV716_03170 [Flagellimonas sp. HMM57]